MKILLDDKEYELGEVTLSQFMKVKQINESNDKMSDSEFISLMTGIPHSEISQATLTQIGFVSKTINMWLQNMSNKEPLRQMVEYKGDMLGLIKPSQMSYGEWTDLEVLFSQKEKNYQHIASILYRPCETYNVSTLENKIVKYDYEECVERSNDMGDFPMSNILSAIFFLISFAEKLTNKHHSSLEVKKKKMMELLHQMKEQKKKN